MGVGVTALPAQTVFAVTTSGPGLHEITGEVGRWVAGIGARAALLTLFVRHTSCSLLIQENADPSVRDDLAAFLGRLAPSADAPGGGWIRPGIFAYVRISPSAMRNGRKLWSDQANRRSLDAPSMARRPPRA